MLRAIAELGDSALRDSLRDAVERGVLVAEPDTGSFRFRHALLAEAIYATILPGEREELHARLAGELARSGAATAAELAPHWAVAGRSEQALVSSVEAARQAEAVFGLAEVHGHLERALALWPAVPDAVELARLDLAGLCSWTAGLASHVGAASRAIELVRRAIELADLGDPHRAALLHVGLGEYLYQIGSDHAALAALERAVMLGRPGDSARLARAGLEVTRRHGFYSALLVSNQIEALLAIGDWDEAERLSAAALRGITSSFPYWLLVIRAGVEIGRGEFDAARAHLETARATLREDRMFGIYDACLADLALWERRWTDAVAAIKDGLVHARSREAAQTRVQMCAQGLRAHAELAALARARRDPGAVRNWLTQAHKLITLPRRAAAEASPVTPNAQGWLALAEAEYARARGLARPESWSAAADNWERLGRCPSGRTAAGVSPRRSSRPARHVPRRSYRCGRHTRSRPGSEPSPCSGIELLAQLARLDLTPPQAAFPSEEQGSQEILGLTAREAEVLNLLARGCTDREIAAALVISVKTVSVHVSHILRKLGAPNRLETAAIAHRLAPPAAEQPEPSAPDRPGL